MAVLSPDEEAKYFPQGEKATLMTGPLCLLRVCSKNISFFLSLPAWILQTLIRASLPPVTKVLSHPSPSSGRKAPQRIPRSWTSSLVNIRDGSFASSELARANMFQILRTSPEQPTARSLPSMEMLVAKTVLGCAGSLKQRLDEEMVVKMWHRSSSPSLQRQVWCGGGVKHHLVEKKYLYRF